MVSKTMIEKRTRILKKIEMYCTLIDEDIKNSSIIYFANVGNMIDSKWYNFVKPSIVNKIEFSGPDFDSITQIIINETFELSVRVIEIDGNNYFENNSRIIISTDLEILKEQFENHVLSILYDTWSGYNGTSASVALKEKCIEVDYNIWEKYPELFI